MRVAIVIIGMACCGLFVATPAQSQFLYLDTNGDGTSSELDAVSATTHATIWLQTDAGRDGAKASGSEDLTLNSYEIILRAVGGTVEWGEYKNTQPSMDGPYGTRFSPTDYYTFYGGSEILQPGKYELGEISFTVKSGNPSIAFVARTPLWASARTSFGSRRTGKDQDNTLKLAADPKDLGSPKEGSGDWADVAGLEAAKAGNLALSTAAVAIERFSASISPNPAKPNSAITVRTTRPGYLRVRLFDVNGKLVRTLLSLEATPSGLHSVELATGRGSELASGVYLYKVESTEATASGRVIVVK